MLCNSLIKIWQSNMWFADMSTNEAFNPPKYVNETSKVQIQNKNDHFKQEDCTSFNEFNFIIYNVSIYQKQLDVEYTQLKNSQSPKIVEKLNQDISTQPSNFNSQEQNRTEISSPQNQPQVISQSQSQQQNLDRNVLPCIKNIFKTLLIQEKSESMLKQDRFLRDIFFIQGQGALKEKKKTSQAQLKSLLIYRPIKDCWKNIIKDRSYEMAIAGSKARYQVKMRIFKKIEYLLSKID